MTDKTKKPPIDLDWRRLPGKGQQISIASSKMIVCVKDRKPFRFQTRAWKQIAETINHIEIGSDGTIWGINTEGNVCRYQGHMFIEIESDIHAKELSVGNEYFVVMLDKKDQIYRLDDDIWEKLPGVADSIAVGDDGEIWRIYDNRIFSWQEDRDSGRWIAHEGNAVQITMGDLRSIHILTEENEIYKLNDQVSLDQSTWELQTQFGSFEILQISAAADGSVVAVTPLGELLIHRGGETTLSRSVSSPDANSRANHKHNQLIDVHSTFQVDFVVASCAFVLFAALYMFPWIPSLLELVTLAPLLLAVGSITILKLDWLPLSLLGSESTSLLASHEPQQDFESMSFGNSSNTSDNKTRLPVPSLSQNEITKAYFLRDIETNRNIRDGRFSQPTTPNIPSNPDVIQIPG